MTRASLGPGSDHVLEVIPRLLNHTRHLPKCRSQADSGAPDSDHGAYTTVDIASWDVAPVRPIQVSPFGRGSTP